MQAAHVLGLEVGRLLIDEENEPDAPRAGAGAVAKEPGRLDHGGHAAAVVVGATGAACDRDGKLASSGRVDEGALARLLAHAYFTRRPPKSLDRTAFDAWLKRVGGLAGISVEDAAATLTAFTAKTLARAAFMLPRPPVSFIVAGGGARNPILMRRIADELAPARVQSADAVGWSAAALEAQALGYLAVRSLRSLPLTFPGTTGVATSTNGGVLVRL